MKTAMLSTLLTTTILSSASPVLAQQYVYGIDEICNDPAQQHLCAMPLGGDLDSATLEPSTTSEKTNKGQDTATDLAAAIIVGGILHAAGVTNSPETEDKKADYVITEIVQEAPVKPYTPDEYGIERWYVNILATVHNQGDGYIPDEEMKIEARTTSIMHDLRTTELIESWDSTVVLSSMDTIPPGESKKVLFSVVLNKEWADVQLVVNHCYALMNAPKGCQQPETSEYNNESPVLSVR